MSADRPEDPQKQRILVCTSAFASRPGGRDGSTGWGSAIEQVQRAPLLDEVRLQATKADVLDEDGENVSYTGGRGRVDAVRAEGMRDDAQILTCGPVGTGQDVRAKANLGADLAIGEVEDSVKLDLVAVEDPREQSLHPDRLTFAEPLQLRDRARAALADVEDPEASRRVEPPAVETRPLAAQRVVAGSEMPKALITLFAISTLSVWSTSAAVAPTWRPRFVSSGDARRRRIDTWKSTIIEFNDR